jgi:hypothetical protein
MEDPYPKYPCSYLFVEDQRLEEYPVLHAETLQHVSVITAGILQQLEQQPDVLTELPAAEVKKLADRVGAPDCRYSLSLVITEYCAIISIGLTVVLRYSELPIIRHVWGNWICRLHESARCMRKSLQKPTIKSKQHIFTSVLSSDSWEIYHVVGEHMRISNVILNNFMQLVNLLNFCLLDENSKCLDTK